MPECNVDNMRLFVEALDSGDYKQGTGSLKRDDKFCCLGVACEVFIKTGGELTVSQDPSTKCECGLCGTGWRTMYDGQGGYLPLKVADWLGIRESSVILDDGCCDPKIVGKRATYWNDAAHATFPEIAAMFRADYLPTA